MYPNLLCHFHQYILVIAGVGALSLVLECLSYKAYAHSGEVFGPARDLDIPTTGRVLI
jgi:hypothetical protein